MIGEEVYLGKEKATRHGATGSWRGLAALLFSTTALVGIAVPALAVDTTWTGVGSDWFSAGNWDTGSVPTNADNVFINTAVITGSHPQINAPFAAGAIVTVGDVADGALTISGPGADMNAVDLVLGVGAAGFVVVHNSAALNVADLLIIGQTSDATITVMDSALSVGGSTAIADGSGTTATLMFLGNATGTFNNGIGLVVGRGFPDGSPGADGRLVVNNGADVEAVNLLLGISSTSIGRATANGAGSTLDISGLLTVGYSGDGTLYLADAAAVTAGNDISVGENAGSNGFATVSTDASLTTGGALIVGNAGTGALTVSSGGDVVAAQLDLGNQASGSGRVMLTGGGSTLTVADQIRVGDNGTGTLNVENGGVLSAASFSAGANIAAMGTATISGAGSSLAVLNAISVGFFGTGTLTVAEGANATGDALILGGVASGSGTVMLTGGGSTLTVADQIRVGDNGTGTLNVENGGVLTAAAFSAGVNSAAMGTATISGAGSSLAVLNAISVGFFGTGTLIVADGANATGDALILGGVASGSGSVTVSDAVLVANGSATIGLSGTGALTISNAGVLNVNAGAGALTIGQNAGSSGVLNIGAADADPEAAAGALIADTVAFGLGGGRLVFNHTGTNYAFDENIVGSGGIIHRAGVTLLTGASNAFAGTAVVTGGSLYVNGTLGGTTNVNGGTLGGSGTLTDALTVASGGTIAPGNSIGTLNVADITINNGSTLSVELDDGGFVAGTDNDLLNATGTAMINGGTVHVTPANGTDNGTTYTPGTYTILTATGGVTGAFDTIIDEYAFLNFALDYDSNNVFLTSSAVTTFCLAGMTANQCATGDGVFSLGSGSLFDAVWNLSNADAPRALDQLSGEIHASANTALIEDSRFAREMALSRLRVAFGSVGADLSAHAQSRVSATAAVWGQGFGSWGSWAGDENAARMGRDMGGFFIGGDAAMTDDVRVGLMAGYSRSSFDVDDRMSSGDANTYTLGAYGGGDWDALSLKGGAAYSWHKIDTARAVAFSGFTDSLSASYDARTAQAFGEAAYGIETGSARFEPFANLAYVNLSTDGFTEDGGAAALTSMGDAHSATFTTLGLRAETKMALGEMEANLRGMAGWRHAFGDSPTEALSFVAVGDAFTIAGVPLTRDALVLEAGFDVNLARNATLGLSYNGQFGSGLADQGIEANLAVKF